MSKLIGVRIESTPHGTSVYDIDSGAQIPMVTGIVFESRVNDLNRATIEVFIREARLHAAASIVCDRCKQDVELLDSKYVHKASGRSLCADQEITA